MTDAMYSSSLEALGKLSTGELEELFQGAKINELILEPGETVFDLAVRIKCLPEGGKPRDYEYNLLIGLMEYSIMY